MNIYIGNLSNDVTEEELTEIFNAYGQVESIKIIKDKFTGNPGSGRHGGRQRNQGTTRYHQ